ncbi:MAG TPA: hypothetical protein VKT77_01305 [Chthonomonadaceae bacterium]|nr:hypothetical protein [Chthonomonadaceae bacterium]
MTRPQDYAAWTELHRRVVLGEDLSASERQAYEAGCRELDGEEVLDGSVARMRELREQIRAALRDQRMMQEKESELDVRIAELEARLDTRTRQLLGIGV